MKFSWKLFLWMFLLIGLIGIVQAIEEYDLTSFHNCSGYSFYVDVSGFGDIYERAYELPGCKLFSATPTNHRWKCDCTHTLNLTLKTLYTLDDTYTVSVLGVSKDVDYDSLSSYEQKKLSVKKFVVENSSAQDTSLTGAVIGMSGKIELSSILFLLLILLVLFFVHHRGGVPWENKTSRAIKLHKRGQNAFEYSKFKKAKQHYKRASNLRK